MTPYASTPRSTKHGARPGPGSWCAGQRSWAAPVLCSGVAVSRPSAPSWRAWS